jgi:hypothetical protein
MAINSCTIDSFTVNTFCSPKRGAIFNKLILELHPTAPITSSASGSARAIRDTFQYQPFEIDDRETLTFEQPFVTVTVSGVLFSGSETQEMNSNLDFVTVTGISFGSADEELYVNISDFKIQD